MKRLLLLTILLLLFLLPGISCAAEEEIHVNPQDPSACATLTEAMAVAAEGDVIILHEGTYTYETETYPIVVDKRVEIRAAQGENVLLRGKRYQAVLRVEAEGVVLQGLDVEFLRYGVLALADGLTVEACRFTLYDPAYRVSSCGVWLAGARHCRVSGCEFVRCGLSMAGPPISESTGNKPVLTALFEIGEDKAYFTSHTVENNLVNGRPLYYFVCQDEVVAPTDAGGLIIADCGHVTIDGLTIAEGSMGIIVAHCAYVEMRNTTADACGLFGVYLTYIDGGKLENVRVTNTNHGIDMRVVQSLEVRNCHTVACDQGIFFSWGMNCLAVDCSARDGKAGFFLAAGNYNVLMNCLAEANENALDVENENNLQVIGNTFRRNKTASIRLNNVTGVFANNLFEDNWVGFISYGRVPQNIVGNRFVRTGGCDIYLLNPTDSIIAGNTMEGSAISVQLVGTVENVIFTGNEYDGAWVDNTTR